MLMESNDIQETTNPNRTSYTTVTYTTLDKGLSITISETITITNNNNSTNQSIPVNTKSYEVILVPTIDNTKTIVVPTKANQSIDQRKIKPRKSSSHQNLIRSIKSSGDSRLAFIDESTDDRTTSSIDGRKIDVVLRCCVQNLESSFCFLTRSTTKNVLVLE